ncbi:MAG TPA: hypothetical protein VG889_04805 [Rhizomicrobium sp.]|nr:hypothetical protein [Rhizomicrobium sp.]
MRPEKTDQPAPSGPCDLQYPSKVPVRCWQGQELFILPRTQSLRSYGYQSFDGGRGTFGHPLYEELAGKTLIVTRVEPSAVHFDGSEKNYDITLKEKVSGETYRTHTVNTGSGPDDAEVSDVVLLRDLVEARNRYLGKSYWIKVKELPKLSMDSYGGAGYADYPKFSRVAITDVLASTDDSHPVRIVLKNAQGEEGYFDIAATPTNRSPIGAVGDADLTDWMAPSDPKLTHKWSAKVWDAIQHERVFAGMSEEMARMSWGAPSDINRTIVGGRHVHEQWVYDHSYLYFDGGILTTIQN